VIVLQWDNSGATDFWPVRDYLPEFTTLGRGAPTLAQRAAAIDAEIEPVPIPWDCRDGFFHAYWRRPDAYLNARVRRARSVWGRLGDTVERRAVAALSGTWRRRNHDLLYLSEAELGARLLIARG
jgi:hypothetical protein